MNNSRAAKGCTAKNLIFSSRNGAHFMKIRTIDDPWIHIERVTDLGGALVLYKKNNSKLLRDSLVAFDDCAAI
jgi:hypothetical protein